MKRFLPLVGILTLMVLGRPSAAQSFVDVPKGHWAYAAVEELAEKGYLTGYPDAAMHGKKALTRYEFALTVSRLVSDLNSEAKNGDSQSQMASLENRVRNLENNPAANPITGIQKSDLDTINKLVDEFKDELSTMGVDLDSLKQEIQDISHRMDLIENQVSHIPEISVTASYIMRGETARSGYTPPVDPDGHRLNNSNRIFQDVHGLTDLDLTLKGKIGNEINSTLVFNYGNYLNSLGGIRGVGSPHWFSKSDFSAPENNGTLWLSYINAPVQFGPIGNADISIGKGK